MTKNQRLLLALLVALMTAGLAGCGANVTAFSSGGSATTPVPVSGSTYTIADYISAMQVCVDAHDAILPGLTPLSEGCTNRRKIREGESIPYHMTAWGDARTPCPINIGTHDNVPVTRNGVTRWLETVMVGYDPCGDTKTPIPAHYEVRMYDGLYGFQLGDWSRGDPGTPGTVGGGVTPQCALGPQTSRRYYYEWPISSVILPAAGQTGYAVFSKVGYSDPLPPITTACPASYPSSWLSIWAHGPFTFTGGDTLDTVVSHPYSQVDSTGTTPGAGAQMERTYWTREFGLSRWEGWKRDDFVNGTTGLTALQLGQATFASGACSKPFDIPSQPTPGMTIGPVTSNGAYAQVVTDLHTGVRHTWYLGECQDVTDLIIVQKLRPSGFDPFPDMSTIPSQFWDFWIPAY